MPLSVLFYIFVLIPVFVETSWSQERLLSPQERLNQLNQQMQAAGTRNAHRIVESCMAEIVEILKEIKAPTEQIRQRAHLRIQYSLSENRLEPARLAAREWLQHHPDDIKAQDYLGTIAFRMNRMLEARDALAIVYQAYPNSAAAQRRYLKAVTKLDEHDIAAEVCAAILTTNQEDSKSLIEVIESYLYFSHAEGAQQALTLLQAQKLQAQNIDLNYINYTHARIGQEKGEWKEALAYLEKVSETSSYYTDSLFRKGLCASNLRDFQAAANIYLQYLSINPDDTRALANFEQTLLRMRKRNGAEIVRNIRQDIASRSVMADEAYYLERQGDTVKSAKLNAQIAVGKNLYTRAESILKNAIGQNPGNLQAQENLAEFFSQTLQASQAESLYKTLLAISPSENQSSIQTKLYKTQLLQGKTKELKEALSSLEPNDPRLEQLQALLGSYYLDIAGDADESIRWLNEARITYENLRPFYFQALVELKRYDDALLEYALIPETYRDSKTTLAYIIALANVNQVTKAQELYSRLLAEHPDLSRVDTIKAQAVLAQAANSKEKESLINTAAMMDKSLQEIRSLSMAVHHDGWKKSVDKLFLLTKLYNKIGKHRDAKKFAQFAYHANPDDADIHQRLIEELNQPMDSLERLYQIRQYQQKHGHTGFSTEHNEVLAHLELNQ